jgi:hypothetical protein
MARNPTEDVQAFDAGGWRKYSNLTGKQRGIVRQRLSEGTWDIHGTWDQNYAADARNRAPMDAYTPQGSGTMFNLAGVGQDPEMSNRVVGSMTGSTATPTPTAGTSPDFSLAAIGANTAGAFPADSGLTERAGTSGAVGSYAGPPDIYGWEEGVKSGTVNRLDNGGTWVYRDGMGNVLGEVDKSMLAQNPASRAEREATIFAPEPVIDPVPAPFPEPDPLPEIIDPGQDLEGELLSEETEDISAIASQIAGLRAVGANIDADALEAILGKINSDTVLTDSEFKSLTPELQSTVPEHLHPTQVTPVVSLVEEPELGEDLEGELPELPELPTSDSRTGATAVARQELENVILADETPTQDQIKAAFGTDFDAFFAWADTLDQGPEEELVVEEPVVEEPVVSPVEEIELGQDLEVDLAGTESPLAIASDDTELVGGLPLVDAYHAMKVGEGPVLTEAQISQLPPELLVEARAWMAANVDGPRYKAVTGPVDEVELGQDLEADLLGEEGVPQPAAKVVGPQVAGSEGAQLPAENLNWLQGTIREDWLGRENEPLSFVALEAVKEWDGLGIQGRHKNFGDRFDVFLDEQYLDLSSQLTEGELQRFILMVESGWNPYASPEDIVKDWYDPVSGMTEPYKMPWMDEVAWEHRSFIKFGKKKEWLAAGLSEADYDRHREQQTEMILAGAIPGGEATRAYFGILLEGEGVPVYDDVNPPIAQLSTPEEWSLQDYQLLSSGGVPERVDPSESQIPNPYDVEQGSYLGEEGTGVDWIDSIIEELNRFDYVEGPDDLDTGLLDYLEDEEVDQVPSSKRAVGDDVELGQDLEADLSAEEGVPQPAAKGAGYLPVESPIETGLGAEVGSSNYIEERGAKALREWDTLGPQGRAQSWGDTTHPAGNFIQYLIDVYPDVWDNSHGDTLNRLMQAAYDLWRPGPALRLDDPIFNPPLGPVQHEVTPPGSGTPTVPYMYYNDPGHVRPRKLYWDKVG